MAKRRKPRATIPTPNNQSTPANTHPKLAIDIRIPRNLSESSPIAGRESLLAQKDKQLAKVMEESARIMNSATKDDTMEGSKGRKATEEAGNQNQPITSKVWENFDISKLRNHGAKLEYVKPQLIGDVLMGKLEDEDVDPEIEFWKNAIVCYVLGANPPYQVMNGFLRRIWGKLGIDKVLLMPNGFLLVRFNSYEAKVEVMKHGVVHFDSRPVIIKDYGIDTDWSRKEIKTVPICVRLPGLPLKYWNAKALGKITSSLGVPVMIDPPTEKKDRIGFARVLIDVAIQEELPEKCFFLNNKEQVIEQKVDYEWRPLICKGCSGYGHLVADCRKGGKEKKVEFRKKEKQVEEKKDKGKEKMDVEQREEIMDKAEEMKNKIRSVEVGSSSKQTQEEPRKNEMQSSQSKGGGMSKALGGSGNKGQHSKCVEYG